MNSRSERTREGTMRSYMCWGLKHGAMHDEQGNYSGWYAKEVRLYENKPINGAWTVWEGGYDHYVEIIITPSEALVLINARDEELQKQDFKWWAIGEVKTEDALTKEDLWLLGERITQLASDIDDLMNEHPQVFTDFCEMVDKSLHEYGDDSLDYEIQAVDGVVTALSSEFSNYEDKGKELQNLMSKALKENDAY